MGIEISGVSKRYGDFVALDDVTLSVPSGGLTALLGPSGSGKTTLLQILGGLESADSGTVEIDGRDTTDVPAQKRNVGFVFQHYAAFKHLTVARNVAFGLEIRKVPKPEIRRRVDELLQLVQLAQFGDRLPAQLSGGQRQRMALARALAIEPSVLLLDEPFGALDAKVRKELRDWLRRLHDEVHVTSVFVTHDQEEALEVADTIVVINHGRVEQIGTPEQLYDHPANEFVFGFLGPVTRLGGVLLRPHDVLVSSGPESGGLPGRVVRWRRIGFEIRYEVELDDAPGAERVHGQLTRTEATATGIGHGDRVWVRAHPGADVLRESVSGAAAERDVVNVRG
ncbi:sulfate ABC transporter ATP-binding protein [Dietzia natronolimnaea]|uniref:sulfate ABC transporter ATP-binding protein n=1 Tax=Dietzia natronolimnaea TaxID=161920 RepID=UPI0015F9D3C7|nr:sulfate ABC transporter ATP-binding protein [Dietzia natronolimnaea]